MDLATLVKKYGSVEHAGKTYTLTDYAEPTSRRLPDYQRDYFEISAPAVDEKGNEYMLYWIFENDGRELDMYDYDNVHRIERR